MTKRTLFLLLGAFVCSDLQAQVFMPTPVAGAEIGLAQATTALPTMQVGLSNPALLGRMEEATVVYAASALPYGQTDWQVVKLDVAQRINQYNGFGVSLATNRVPGYNETYVHGHYGRRIFKKACIGATIGYQAVQAAEYGHAGSPMFKVSLYQQLTKRWSIGASLLNPGNQKLRNTHQTNQLNLGLAWRVTHFMASADIAKELGKPTHIRLGMSYEASERLYCMFGLQTSSPNAKISGGFGFWVSSALRIDVAGSWHDTLGITPTLGVQYARK